MLAVRSPLQSLRIIMLVSGVITATFIAALSLSSGPSAAAELIMLEEDGCPWCEQWNKEVGVVYDKTPEGKRVPLRRLDIHDPLPPELKFLVKGGYTPTFVLVDNGRELGRIRGYPGEDFFWGLFGQLLKRLPEKQ